MKRVFLPLLACLFLISACESVSVSPEIQNGIVLERIDHATGNQTWQEVFEYNDQGQLATAEDQRGLGQKKTFFYSGGLTLATETVRQDTDELIFRDSLVYNADGRLTQVYQFSINGGIGVPLSSIQTFNYNSTGQVVEVNSEFVGITDYNPRRVYTWENGNIVKEDQYNGDELQHEFYLTYDTRRALNAASIFTFNQLLVPTRNNVINVDWTDHTGLLDTACKPCSTNYTYNNNDLPASMTTNWGYTASFSYKVLPQLAGQ